METLFAWIQLSDIHIGHGGASHAEDQRLVLEALRTDITRLHRDDSIPNADAILVTGDIAFSGNDHSPTEYRFASEQLRAIGAAARIDPEMTFVVPGNHDVQRSADQDRNASRLLTIIREGGQSIDEVLRHEGDCTQLARRFANYVAFATDFAPACRKDAERPGAQLYWRHRLAVRRGLTVRLIGLNTALLAADERTFGRDLGKLRLGNVQLTDTLLEPSPTDNEVVLLLTHHPFNGGWLADERGISEWTRRHVHIHLSGHIHESESEELRSGSGGSVLRIVAGAVHGDQAPASVRARHGYNIAAIVIENGHARLRVWPRLWSERNREFRTDIDAAHDGSGFASHDIPRFPSTPTNGAASAFPQRHSDAARTMPDGVSSVSSRAQGAETHQLMSTAQTTPISRDLRNDPTTITGRAVAGFTAVTRPDDHSRSRQNHAAIHRRHIVIYENGIAHVHDEFRDLTVHGRLTLATLSEIHRSVYAATYAETSQGMWPVIVEEGLNGDKRYVLVTSGSPTERLSWRYSISNSFLLHSDEATMRSSIDPRFDVGDEYHAIEPQLPTDRFEFVINYDATLPGVMSESVHRIVERPRYGSGNVFWDRVPEEEIDNHFRFAQCDSHCIEVVIESPLDGYRYAIAYRMNRHYSTTIDSEALLVARTVLERCRHERTWSDGFSSILSKTLEASFKVWSPEGAGPNLSIVGFLWHSDDRSLLAAYGRMRNSHWESRFYFGSGVAGHAFRFSTTATWHRRTRAASSLIYRPSQHSWGHAGSTYPHEWIISVPILSLHGGAIGVVSFASDSANTEPEFRLSLFAETHERDPDFEPNLRFMVNYAFWDVLSSQETEEPRDSPVLSLPKVLHDYADNVKQWLERVATEIEDPFDKSGV